MEKIAIYGGTFDPIHKGHLHVIEQVILQGLADRILLIPAGEPLLRESQPGASGAQRRAMCVQALNDLPTEISKQVEVNPIEILRSGPSYAIDTVDAVAQTFPGAEILMIVGTDAFAKIAQWHRSDELQDKVDFLVIDRPEFPGDATVDIGALNISATQVRAGELDALSPHVATYIKEHNLYASK